MSTTAYDDQYAPDPSKPDCQYDDCNNDFGCVGCPVKQPDAGDPAAESADPAKEWSGKTVLSDGDVAGLDNDYAVGDMSQVTLIREVERAIISRIEYFPPDLSNQSATRPQVAQSQRQRPNGDLGDEREALRQIMDTAKGGANSGDRHARCVEIARAALSRQSSAGDVK